ncbi:MAG: hypothetical protein NZM44_03890, partial [Candidatus Calescibacterium sp.]|nr:hypothetical protein [Candidatus Calescibacterium sp.]
MSNIRKLSLKLLNQEWFDSSGNLIKDKIHEITIPEFRIFNSKFVGKSEDKFETMLFLPEGEGRQGEGGLRTKGYFKFSYKLMGDGLWYMCDLDG